jgi:NhaP-type Na+/H+ or K+/H+ antiporter
VLFQVAVGTIAARDQSAGDVGLLTLRLAGGGTALGLLAGAVAAWLLVRCRSAGATAVVEVVTPFAIAGVAEVAGISGVTAVIVAGLVVAGRRSPRLADDGGAHDGRVEVRYARAAVVLENAAFLVIGLQLASYLRQLPADRRGVAAELVGVAVGVLLVVRAIAVAALAARRRRTAPDRREDAGWRAAAVVTWAGTRGVVPLAAALAIPESTNAGRPFPHRPLLVVVALAVVVVTLVVQGTTLRPLVHRLGVTTRDDTDPSDGMGDIRLGSDPPP